MAKNCGFITHVKGSPDVKGHTSFVSAVEAAKKQTKPTGVLSVCGGQVKRLAVCSNGSCGNSGSAGLGRVGRARRKRRLGKAVKTRRRARRRS